MATLLAIFLSGASFAQDKPNILVIWGDDIGQSNISAYTMGVVGYRTPNIDRIADEGMIFTDYYGEQSCTAGRSSYIMGQSVYRTGLSKVGLRSPERIRLRNRPVRQKSPWRPGLASAVESRIR
jgi:arylsulfatase